MRSCGNVSREGVRGGRIFTPLPSAPPTKPEALLCHKTRGGQSPHPLELTPNTQPPMHSKHFNYMLYLMVSYSSNTSYLLIHLFLAAIDISSLFLLYFTVNCIV